MEARMAKHVKESECQLISGAMQEDVHEIRDEIKGMGDGFHSLATNVAVLVSQSADRRRSITDIDFPDRRRR